MDEPVKPFLKIADTPDDDPVGPDGPPTDVIPAASIRPAKRRKRRSKTQRVSEAEMDREIRRINLANGRPMIALVPEPDSGDDA